MAMYKNSFNKSDDDIDVNLNEINETDDLDVVRNLCHNFKRKIARESQHLKCAEQEMSRSKEERNSDKCFVSEVVQLEGDKQKTISNLRAMIGDNRVKLEELHDTQVSNLEQFENSALKSAEEFISLPKSFESGHISHKVEELLKELEEYMTELYQYRQELKVDENKLSKYSAGTDEGNMDNSLTAFDERICSMDELNETMIKSVKELEIKTNVMNQFGALNIKYTKHCW